MQRISPFGKDPVKFLRHNLFRLHDSLDNPPLNWVQADGTVLVQLVDATDSHGVVLRSRNRTGLAAKMPKSVARWWTKPTRIYQVMPAKKGDSGAFPAYICPFVYNSACFKMLESAADVMFTGDMDGCTFGAGIPNANGGVRVGHANAKQEALGDLPDPNAVQRQSQMKKLVDGGLTRFVDPDVYSLPNLTLPNPDRPGKWLCREYKAITIGVRIQGQWEFYYQHQLVDGKDWREGLSVVKVQ